jgi:hypothetical protein
MDVFGIIPMKSIWIDDFFLTNPGGKLGSEFPGGAGNDKGVQHVKEVAQRSTWCCNATGLKSGKGIGLNPGYCWTNRTLRMENHGL